MSSVWLWHNRSRSEKPMPHDEMNLNIFATRIHIIYYFIYHAAALQYVYVHTQTRAHSRCHRDRTQIGSVRAKLIKYAKSFFLFFTSLLCLFLICYSWAECKPPPTWFSFMCHGTECHAFFLFHHNVWCAWKYSHYIEYECSAAVWSNETEKKWKKKRSDFKSNRNTP